MSAIRQIRPPESDANPTPNPEVSGAGNGTARDNPLQLLRDAIAQLKSPSGGLPDQEQVANLLAEAREALEHANVVARAAAQCEAHVKEGRFDQAFEALDEGLLVYPGDLALLARRGAVEERQKAFVSAAAVRGAIEEAKWLLDHDRTDLAAQFLKEKAAELPDQEELSAHLAELEALLPEWERKRHVQDALGRAETLEQLQQWQAALTVIEEAQQSYPSSAELRHAAARVGNRLMEHEREKKLARRLELIRQQIATRSWRQALTFLENTQADFPEADELKPLRREITAGLKRSECNEVVADVRKFLADSELEQAESALIRGLEALGDEPELVALCEELEAVRKYGDDLRNAQVLFGRRQFEEAERVLSGVIGPERPEAQALLDAVRAARAAHEEESFLERGRQKALGLIQQQQFGQAVDLLRNLLALFPGHPILERDLAGAQSALQQAVAVPAVASLEEEEQRAEAEPQVAPVVAAAASDGTPRRFRRAAIAGTASLVLASVAGATWKLTHPAPVARTKTAPTAASTPAPVSPAPQPQATVPDAAPAPSAQPPVHQAVAVPEPPNTAKAQPKAVSKATLQPFVPPSTSPAPAGNRTAALPAPPADPVITQTSIPVLPVNTNVTVKAPEPPPSAAPAAAAAPPKPIPAGGRIEQAQLINKTVPVFPPLARQRAVSGTIRLSAMIDEHGDVKNVKVLSGDIVLGAAAKAAVQKWKYKPAMLNGNPIQSETLIQIVFGERDR
jgi:protein TonB